MKVALIGYGKMGRAIEAILVERGHEIVARIGSEGNSLEQLQQADVAIEFTRPESAFENLKTCFELNIPVVTGTTGWLDRYDEAVELCNQSKGALLYASNFSLGVNLFFEVNAKLAQMMKGHSSYEVSMEEIHHTQKKDAPSGTAITLAEQIIDELPAVNGWSLTGEDSKINISAKRIDNIPGTHIVTYASAIDDIEIKHTAHNRKGFALGAVMAAEFLKDKSGIYKMKDVLNI